MTIRRPVHFALALMFSAALPMKSWSEPPGARGAQFIPLAGIASFRKIPGTNDSTRVFISPEIGTRLAFDELIVSWNASLQTRSSLLVEGRIIYPERTSKWFRLGYWAGTDVRESSRSFRDQGDADGDVETDTLVLRQPAEKLQLRVSLAGVHGELPKVKFIGLSVRDSRVRPPLLPPNRRAWGKELAVPQRSQMWYPDGEVLCSPTTVSMLMSYWAEDLNRPGLDVEVPEVVRGVYDPTYGGAGNWVFNTAYAGSFRWMRSYTTRLTDVAELESFIVRGIPVGLSLCYNRLRGKGREPSGHLVVCVGFTETGDVIINDPGTSKDIRKIFPRANLIDAWAHSKNTVYLVYPSNRPLPFDEFGHWESRRARRFAGN